MTSGLLLWCVLAAAPALDERPAVEGEWGYRPGAGDRVQVTAPGFTWRPTPGIVAWELQVGRGDAVEPTAYRAEGITLNVHCPPRTFEPGRYTWRYRGRDAGGQMTDWSQPRSFTIAADATPLPLPTREELRARVPRAHPRLLVRPEQRGELQALAAGPLKDRWDRLLAECDKLVATPPPTAEPPTYPEGMEKQSEAWLKIWWGNRTYTMAALDGAARLAFASWLGGNETYGELAKRIFLDCARWDPKGSTGYRYNDEAGMPYAYLFARCYTWLHDRLSEDERAVCRQVIKVRGDEMYSHLSPRHLWQPYSSHSNRAWHKLGELAIAGLGEVEGAEDWLWFAMNVFFNVYPVWSDDDGGWHEGAAYWDSYLGRFTYWADVMRVAMGIDAYDQPFFRNAGNFALYLMPPGKTWAGFGDLTTGVKATGLADVMTIFATQAGNPHWQWWVEQNGGPVQSGGYLGFIRGTLPPVTAQAPTDLPTSRLFRGTGQAMLNSTLLSAADAVQVLFKSSPFGTQSHGFEANNSFMLSAYGQPLLINSGRRDTYGSDHHRRWMWSTRSQNNITVDGHGQVAHSSRSKGRITAFATTPALDLVSGEAGDAYRVPPTEAEKAEGKGERRLLERFTRTILFAKPDLVVVFDRLVAPQPATFTYWLHSPATFTLPEAGGQRVGMAVGDVRGTVDFLTPGALQFAQTDQYDPNPRERIKVREWHLTATSSEPAADQTFVALYRTWRGETAPPTDAELTPLDGGYALRAALPDGELVALLPNDEGATLRAMGLESRGAVVAERRGARESRVVAEEL